MGILDIKLKLDITPNTTLAIPGDGRVVVRLKGSVDVPEPLLAQQLWDAAKDAVEKGRVRLQESIDKLGDTGTEADVQKRIDKVFEYIHEKANKAVQGAIDSYMQMNKTYQIVQKQDVSMAAKSVTSIALNVVRLVVSAGTDVAAATSLAKTLYDAAKYLYKALVDISDVDEKTRTSILEADKYYREKVMKGKEGNFDKFKKFFSDPMKNALENVEDMQKRLARAEEPCHKMAAVIQELLEQQDGGDSSRKVEEKLNLLLISVSDTMGKVTPATESLKKQEKVLNLLRKDLKAVKSDSKSSLAVQKYMEPILEQNKKLQKYVKDNGLKDWKDAAKSTVDLAKELAKLLA